MTNVIYGTHRKGNLCRCVGYLDYNNRVDICTFHISCGWYESVIKVKMCHYYCH